MNPPALTPVNSISQVFVFPSALAVLNREEKVRGRIDVFLVCFTDNDGCLNEVYWGFTLEEFVETFDPPSHFKWPTAKVWRRNTQVQNLIQVKYSPKFLYAGCVNATNYLMLKGWKECRSELVLCSYTHILHVLMHLLSWALGKTLDCCSVPVSNTTLPHCLLLVKGLLQYNNPIKFDTASVNRCFSIAKNVHLNYQNRRLWKALTLLIVSLGILALRIFWFMIAHFFKI